MEREFDRFRGRGSQTTRHVPVDGGWLRPIVKTIMVVSLSTKAGMVVSRKRPLVLSPPRRRWPRRFRTWGAFDNALRRMKMPSDFCDEAIASARTALAEAFGHEDNTQ